MKTLFLVMAQFGSAEIALADLCEPYFSMSLRTAERRAAVHQLPVPFYKKSGKSGWFCSAVDWANHIDEQAKKAHEEWEKMNA